MSKIINIIVNRTTQQATGDKIRTTLMDGGSQDWVPQEEYVNLINKENITIDENGNYLPSDFSCDAIGTVTVKFGDGMGIDGLNLYKGPGTITGIDPLTGEPTSVSVDPNGDIHKEEIPDHIEVVIPPGVSTIYEQGAIINYNQYNYVAFKANGDPFPINPDAPIPNLIDFSEMEFPYERAPYVDESGNEEEGAGTISSGSSHTGGSF